MSKRFYRLSTRNGALTLARVGKLNRLPIQQFAKINHHVTPHRPQDRLRIQGIARHGGKLQSAGASHVI